MNDGERRLVEYENGMSGSFYKAFFETIFRADPSNQARLAQGFPAEVKAVQRYQNEKGYWQKLLEEYRQSVISKKNKKEAFK